MENKNTDDLRVELMESSNIDEFLSENEDCFVNESISDVLNRLLAEKNISKSVLAKNSGISEVYLHQIFAGRRNPSRNRIICLCYGLGATFDETQELLKLCSSAQLYPKNRRDAIIIYGLVHGLSLFEINDKLFTEDQETLF